MDEKFLTKGIEKERYLKAKELGDRFEDEIYELIGNVFSDFVEKSELFRGNGSPNPKSTPTEGKSTKATLRIDYKIANVEAEGTNDPNHLKLTVGLEWPKESSDVAKSIESGFYVFYRVKNSHKKTFEEIYKDTEVQKIHYANNPWNSKYGMFYIPVKSVDEILEGFEELKVHFTKFGDRFGEPVMSSEV
ncbi:hypothetical protein KGY77_08505 [Candidatus Bipolaricaulota bacterium]|nr:hypothetical protein [Candidatus Bipolaricaulota bacterium]